MTDKPPNNDAEQPGQASADSDGPLSEPQIDATIMFDPSASDTNKVRRSTASKQDRDLAFAAILVRLGTLTERQLAQATTRWTTHGAESLGDHLVTTGVITGEQHQTLLQHARSELQRIESEISRHTDWSRTQQDRLWLDRLDHGGRIAKLLGIADAPVLTADEVESRQVGARYTLLRRLGQGGLGTVWLAMDENLQRYVAVKEISRENSAGSVAEAHFRREAEITGKLEHPGIVPVYQFGVDEQTGRSFYAMRFLGKRTLQDAIAEYHERREAGDDDRVLKHRLITAFINVCQAVAHAHSRKIIHRDLKPENIAIDSFGQIVLLDWGLAKINEDSGMYEVRGEIEPGDLHSIGSSHTGRVLGTPLYMAPEQAAGRLDEIDELTDVYGLGGILYAILTGEGPNHRGIDAADGATGATEVLAKVAGNIIKPPVEVVDSVTPELNAICLKALSNKRYLRYESANNLAKDIENYRTGSPVAAYNPPVWAKAKRWMAAHPTLTQLLMLMAAVICIALAANRYTRTKGELALQEARYHSLENFVREIDINLQFESRELVQDVRFLNDFPLTRAVVASQMPETLTDGKFIVGESEVDIAEVRPDEWLARQGRLIDGILEANPEYLVISNVRFANPNMTELVRSERIATGMRPRRVPQEQLYSGSHPESDNQFYDLRPGEVILTTGDQLAENVPTKNRSPLVIVAICPIFDETGKFFGINVIEVDLRARLEEMFHSSAHDDFDVFVTDRTGGIAMAYQDGEESEVPAGQAIESQFPTLAPLFGKSPSANAIGNSKTLYATRVRLGRTTTDAQLIIVARIAGGDL